jgi:CHASE1-domain containing sensor protein
MREHEDVVTRYLLTDLPPVFRFVVDNQMNVTLGLIGFFTSIGLGVAMTLLKRARDRRAGGRR